MNGHLFHEMFWYKVEYSITYTVDEYGTATRLEHADQCPK